MRGARNLREAEASTFGGLDFSRDLFCDLFCDPGSLRASGLGSLYSVILMTVFAETLLCVSQGKTKSNTRAICTRLRIDSVE